MGLRVWLHRLGVPLFVKGQARPAGAGRKSAKDKLRRTALEVINGVSLDLGSRAGLLKWVKADTGNERVFWKDIYPKILPLQLAGAGGSPLTIHLLPQDRNV